jgi:ABC-type multidrug transport system ATPase subunit
MRRRLSIAMSVVGNPPIIFMDEPTTGLDPDNKNHVWSIIQSLKSPSRLILMTTHSMEEAEALCSRIGIMARGELQCIGTSSHLKKKYGKGYTLTINLLKYSPPPPPPHHGHGQGQGVVIDKNSPEYLEAEAQYERHTDQQLVQYVIGQLSSGQGKLISSINRTKKFLIPKVIQGPHGQGQGSERVMHISEIFKEMETHRNELQIREWGLSMSTLEDVFISAVKSGGDDEEEEGPDGGGAGEDELELVEQREKELSALGSESGNGVGAKGHNPLLK